LQDANETGENEQLYAFKIMSMKINTVRFSITRTSTGNRKSFEFYRIERKCSKGPEKWFELRKCSSNRGSSYRESTVTPVLGNIIHIRLNIA